MHTHTCVCVYVYACAVKGLESIVRVFFNLRNNTRRTFFPSFRSDMYFLRKGFRDQTNHFIASATFNHVQLLNEPKSSKLEARHKFVKNATRSIHILLTFYLETSIFRRKQKKVERRYITNYRGARCAQEVTFRWKEMLKRAMQKCRRVGKCNIKRAEKRKVTRNIRDGNFHFFSSG